MEMLDITKTYENNTYAETTLHIPFDIILYYYADKYAGVEDDEVPYRYYVVLNNSQEVEVDDKTYNKVAEYFKYKRD